MRSLKPGVLVATLVLTLLGPAAWCKPPETKSELVGKVHVETKDLDLTKPADARTMLDRLKQAAYRACGGNPKLHDTYRTRPEQTVRVYEECRENAVKRAVDQIGAPLLVQAYTQEQQHAAAANGCSDRESRLLASARSHSGA
jgi:UrcA family protein